MISETFFSNHYASIWRSIAPAMEDFVRRMNMDGYELEWAPIPSSSEPRRRGVINEAGFIAFSKSVALTKEEAAEGLRKAVDDGFKDAQEFVYGEFAEDLGFLPNTAEQREAILIAGRLLNYFRRRSPADGITTSPYFAGNGMMSRCVGDVLVRDPFYLYEIKSGDRNFRSVDYRQLSVYGALHFAEHGEVIRNFCLVNPRRGVAVEVTTEEFSVQVSGQSAVTYFQSLIDCFSGMLVSN